ncbi:tyrosinase family protein [Photobacterium sp. Hal280]|uniref:tyrosinase family protein n=1 Tax=Photobacterium sp. Hal280 TaxID=3035163 RepID=UPI00301CC72B
MTTIAKLNYRRKLAGLPLIRFNLLRLNPQDMNDLRDAYAAMYEISDIAVGDRRGYFSLARGHGYDQDLCHDDNRVFLTWHRSYIYSFEKALNTALQWKRKDKELELTLPYWDWTQFSQSTHAANGLPKVLNDPRYKNAEGVQLDNPLNRAKSLYRITSQGLEGDEQYTQRFPSAFKSIISQLKNDIERYMDNPNFMRFQEDFDFGAHGAVHVYVGGAGNSPLPQGSGDMSSVISAAYDPLFWLHHSMVDKVWFDWQTLHPDANIPTFVQQKVVYDGRIGRDLIDAENSLKYIYSDNSVESAIAATGTTNTLPAKTLSAAASLAKELSMGLVEGGFVRAQLDFLRLHPPKSSYEIRAYINNPACNASTGYDDESYSGRLVLFGHGTCHGASGHCNPTLAVRDDYDIRTKHPLRYEHTRYSIDLTRGLRRFIGRKKSVDDLKIYLLVIDAKGKAVPPETLKYDGCSLRTFAKK